MFAMITQVLVCVKREDYIEWEVLLITPKYMQRKDDNASRSNRIGEETTSRLMVEDNWKGGCFRSNRIGEETARRLVVQDNWEGGCAGERESCHCSVLSIFILALLYVQLTYYRIGDNKFVSSFSFYFFFWHKWILTFWTHALQVKPKELTLEDIMCLHNLTADNELPFCCISNWQKEFPTMRLLHLMIAPWEIWTGRYWLSRRKHAIHPIAIYC